MKRIRIRKWVKVALVLVILYLVFSYIDKKDNEAIENCSKTYDRNVCERMVYGY